MKNAGIYIMGVMLGVVIIISQLTIRNKSATIKNLQEACAVYHRKLTGEPHPFYAE